MLISKSEKNNFVQDGHFRVQKSKLSQVVFFADKRVFLQPHLAPIIIKLHKKEDNHDKEHKISI